MANHEQHPGSNDAVNPERPTEYPTAPRESKPQACGIGCVIRNRAAKIIYTTRLQAALDDLVRRVGNGSQPVDIAPYVARDHKVSEEDLASAYDERAYRTQSTLEVFSI